MEPELKTALQDQLDQSLLFTPCLGINVTLKDETHGFWAGASGFSEPKTKTPMLMEEQFYIYSITKTFTSVCILQMVQKQKLFLDAPATTWLPNLPFPPSVTLRRLLSHTSGVPNYTSLEAYAPGVQASPSVPWPYNKMLELTCHGQLDFEPGSSWKYSNTGYMLLLKVIETVSGDNFSDVLRSNIFNPLGLHKTYVAQSIDRETLTPGFCRYLNAEKLMENVIPKYHPGWCATGVIVSTTSDTVRFYEALFSGQLIAPEQLNNMCNLVPTGQSSHPFFSRPFYGLGVMLAPGSARGEKIGHGGDGPGYNTFAVHLPNFKGRKLTIAVFCNTSMGTHPFYLINDLLYLVGNA